MANKIRWTKSDYISLGKAVASFNKSVANLSSSGIVLPDLLKYKDLKSGITTRKELNRMISSLKRFQNPMEQVGVTLESGLEITKWELTEVKKARTRAVKRLSGELANIEGSVIGTGNVHKNEIKAMINSYKTVFEQQYASDFKRISGSILRQGKTDFDFKKATIFQQNFINAYTTMGRTEIVEFAKSFRDPEEFWKAIQNSGFIDIKERYDVEEGTMQLAMSKDESYYAELEKLGII